VASSTLETYSKPSSISLQASSEVAAALETYSPSLEVDRLGIHQDVVDSCDPDLHNHWKEISIKNTRSKAITDS